MRSWSLIVALTLPLIQVFALPAHAQARPEPVLRSPAPGTLDSGAATDRGSLHDAAVTPALPGWTNAGVSTRLQAEPSLSISADTSGPRRFSLLKHVLVGAGIGLIAGTAVGVRADLKECGDCMLPLTPFAAAGGTVAGTLGGFIVWGVRTIAEDGRARE